MACAMLLFMFSRCVLNWSAARKSGNVGIWVLICSSCCRRDGSGVNVDEDEMEGTWTIGPSSLSCWAGKVLSSKSAPFTFSGR